MSSFVGLLGDPVQEEAPPATSFTGLLGDPVQEEQEVPAPTSFAGLLGEPAPEPVNPVIAAALSPAEAQGRSEARTESARARGVGDMSQWPVDERGRSLRPNVAPTTEEIPAWVFDMPDAEREAYMAKFKAKPSLAREAAAGLIQATPGFIKQAGAGLASPFIGLDEADRRIAALEKAGETAPEGLASNLARGAGAAVSTVTQLIGLGGPIGKGISSIPAVARLAQRGAIGKFIAGGLASAATFATQSQIARPLATPVMERLESIPKDALTGFAFEALGPLSRLGPTVKVLGRDVKAGAVSVPMALLGYTQAEGAIAGQPQDARIANFIVLSVLHYGMGVMRKDTSKTLQDMGYSRTEAEAAIDIVEQRIPQAERRQFREELAEARTLPDLQRPFTDSQALVDKLIPIPGKTSPPPSPPPASRIPEQVTAPPVRPTEAVTPEKVTPPAGELIEMPIRENGARTSVILADGTAIVGGKTHGENVNYAIRKNLITEDQLRSGTGGFTRSDGTSWDLQGKPIAVKKIINLDLSVAPDLKPEIPTLPEPRVAGAAESAGKPPERGETKSPELMTPEEFAGKQPPTSLTTGNNFGANPAYQKYVDLKRDYRAAILWALTGKKPVSASGAESENLHGTRIMKGYVREGDHYVFKSPTPLAIGKAVPPAPAPSTAPAVGQPVRRAKGPQMGFVEEVLPMTADEIAAGDPQYYRVKFGKESETVTADDIIVTKPKAEGATKPKSKTTVEETDAKMRALGLEPPPNMGLTEKGQIIKRAEAKKEAETAKREAADGLTTKAINALETHLANVEKSTKGKAFAAELAIPVVVYKAGLKVAISALKTGRSIKQAIDEAVAHFKANHKGKFSEDAERTRLFEAISAVPEGYHERQTIARATAGEPYRQPANTIREEGRSVTENRATSENIAASKQKALADPAGSIKDIRKTPDRLVRAEKAAGHLQADKEAGRPPSVEVLDLFAQDATYAGTLLNTIRQLKMETPEGLASLHMQMFQRFAKTKNFETNAVLRKQIQDRFAKAESITVETLRSKALWDATDFAVSHIPRWTRSWATDVWDAYRYTNMLSNPRSHARNILSNAFNLTVARPISLVGQGRFKDALRYEKAALGSVADGFKAFGEALRQHSNIKNYDVDRPGGPFAQSYQRQKVPKALTVIPRLMEATDMLFGKMIESGETMRLVQAGVDPAAATQRAQKLAEQYLYREQLGATSSAGSVNVFSRAVDGIGVELNQLRRNNNGAIRIPSKVLIPFVRTPIKVAQLNLEFGPWAALRHKPGAGATKGWGSAFNEKVIAQDIAQNTLGKPYERLTPSEKTTVDAEAKMERSERRGRVVAGSVVLAIGGTLAAMGRTTWAAPSDKKAREAFYASGRKAYSVKIGDKWVPMMYFGPFALALAVPAAIRDVAFDNPKLSEDTYAQHAGTVVQQMLRYFMTQTPLQGMSNFIEVAMGNEDWSTTRGLGFLATQAIPLSGLQSYVTRLIDPKMPLPKTIGETAISGVPGLSSMLPYRKDSKGQPIERTGWDIYPPYDIGVSDAQANEEYQKILEHQRVNVQRKAEGLKPIVDRTSAPSVSVPEVNLPKVKSPR